MINIKLLFTELVARREQFAKSLQRPKSAQSITSVANRTGMYII